MILKEELILISILKKAILLEEAKLRVDHHSSGMTERVKDKMKIY
jgi:hypothetical protein